MKIDARNLMDRNDHRLLARATTFNASAFRGRGSHETVSCPTLAEARIAANALYNDRPVGVYGVTPEGRSVFIENVDPRRNNRTGEPPMTIYVLLYRAPSIDSLEVYKLPAGADRVRASAFVSSTPEDRGAAIVEHVDDLTKLSGPLLVKIYNELIKAANARLDPSGTTIAKGTVTKFESLPVGRQRVFREMIDAAVDLPEDKLTAAETAVKAAEPIPVPAAPIAPAAAEDHPPTTEGDTTVAKAKKKTSDAPKRSRSKISPDAKISVLVENPKRAGTEAHKRFAMYREGMKVSTFLEKGGTAADLNWDVKKKFIKLEKPAS